MYYQEIPPAPTVGGWALAVSAYSKNKKEAFEFIDFVVNNGMKELFFKRGDIPTKADGVKVTLTFADIYNKLEELGNLDKIMITFRSMGSKPLKGFRIFINK